MPATALATRLALLAETPDDAPDLDAELEAITQLTADRVAAASFASVTALSDRRYTTVAVGSDLARAVDEAQYADLRGPCVHAPAEQAPKEPSVITATMRWPGFAKAAVRLGLRASVSIPLFTGSGGVAAVLDVFGRDHTAMAPLIAGIWRVYDPDRALPHAVEVPEPGAQELVDGFAAAVVVRATIQRALYVVMDQRECFAYDAYLALRTRAGEEGVSLRAMAEAVLARSP